MGNKIMIVGYCPNGHKVGEFEMTEDWKNLKDQATMLVVGSCPQCRRQKISIYSCGLTSMSVCVDASLSRTEIEALANLEHPTGIASPWKIAQEDIFADGSPMPGICDANRKRRHWLLHC